MPGSQRYRIERRIAKGGMAEVFEATSIGAAGFERRVALKQMIPEASYDDSFARMFVDEARITSRLHHANIVSVLDYGVVDNRPFQVMELVDGMDAGRIAERGRELGNPLPVELALHICREVALALDYAHDATDDDGEPLGIVHRDVSPANVLVSWNGDVKLADFGIALARGRKERTEAGITKGKLSYMSPEQALSETLDRRTDVFSLGCTLHAILVGHSPLRGEATVRRLYEQTDPDLDAALDDDVLAIIARATRYHRADRYPTAGEMAADLDAAIRRRLTGDPRRPLRRWLDEVRPDGSRRERSVKNDLWNVLLLPDAGSGERRFRTETMGVPRRLGSEAEMATLAAPPGAATRSSRRSRRGRWLALGLGLAAVGTVLAGLAGVSGEGSARSAAYPDAETPGERMAIRRAAGAAAAADAGGSDVVARSEKVAVELDAGTRSVRRPERPRGRDRHRRAGRDEATPSEEPARPRPEAPEDGLAVDHFVLVAGPGAVGTLVYVDGTLRGGAPGNVRLALGTHELELRRHGETVATRTVEIGPSHTRTSPLRWYVE